MSEITPAIPGLLQQFEPRLRHEAERLVEDSAVVNLDSAEGQVDADVMMDDKAVHVRWRLGEGGWSGLSDCDESARDADELHDLALCAVLVAIQKQSFHADLFAESAQPLQLTVERRLGRGLSLEESGYAGKVEKRYQRAQLVGQVFDHDMVRLHPKWAIESTEPLALWPAKPRSVVQFWNYIALALDDRGLAFPAFMRCVTDLDVTRERLREWRQARTVPQWAERIRRFASAPEPADTRRECDFRLVITTNEARLRMRQGREGDFQPVSAAQIEMLKTEHAAGLLVMEGAAELLLLACFRETQEKAVDSFRLDAERHAVWLNGLLHQPDLASRLVTLDDLPVRHAEERIVWDAADDEKEAMLRLRLRAAGGGPLPWPLRMLPGAEVLYLSGEAVYRGPVWFGEDTRVEQSTSIPLQALSSADGIVFLERLGVALPEVLKKKIRREKLSVEVRAGCVLRPGQIIAEHVALSVRAVDEAGFTREMLRDAGWQRVAAPPQGEEDAIVCFDRAALGPARDALSSLRASWDADQAAFRLRVTKQFPEQFQRWAAALPQAVKLTTDDKLQTILADPLVARVRVEAAQTESIDWFDLRLIFEIEGSDLSQAEIRRLVGARGGFVQLADGTWRRVQIELTDEQREIIEKLGIDLDEFSDEAHRVHMRHLAGQKAGEFIHPKAWERIAARLTEAELSLRPGVPEPLRVTLRPYQVEGYHFLAYLTANRIGGILADDMGLGKTVQSIAWILWLRDRAVAEKNGSDPGAHLPPPALVVCPKSVLDVWATEFAKSAPHLRVQVLHDKDELRLEGLRESVDVLVLNYAQLRGCIESLVTIHWLAVILDEGQQIKNPDSKAAKAARRLGAHNRLVLTGTPLENRLLDLWSLMTFATPGALGDRAYFHRHFDRRKDDRASERLSARLRPFLIRRTKGQVAKELPPRTEETMLCEMSGIQERLYREELARAQMMVMAASSFDAITKQRFAILQALTRLRQICCHPGLVDHSARSEESAKLLATLELVEELHAEGHKVLLFSQFVRMLAILRDHLVDKGIPHHWLTGASTNRAEIVRNFQEDPSASVFLLSLKAGGSGLNLTAASYVILYDPWWNPAVEAQAIDRAHRIGQTQPVMAYRMLTRHTIEEKILLLQQKKQMMSSSILGEEGFARGLDREDFAFLFDLETTSNAPAVRENKETLINPLCTARG